MKAFCVLAIGNFDGVHAGHRHLIEQAESIAEQAKLPLHILTFWPHPRTVVRPDAQHQNLMTPSQREAALLNISAEKIHTLPFNLELASLSPQAFIQDILIEKLSAKHIVIGENFRFGHKAAGTPQTLSAELAFTTHIIPLLSDDKGAFSSTRLRAEQS